jgi:hypothetical protein
MSLAANLAKLGKLLLAQASGVINGPTPNAGDNSQAVINSAWFKAEQATETAQGTAKVATQATTNAGTDDTTIVTPKKLRAGFAISLGTNGYITFPTWLGGLIIQWGTISASTGWAWTYPIAFPTQCAGAYATNGDTGATFVALYSATKTSVFGNRWNTSGQGASGSTTILVIGY